METDVWNQLQPAIPGLADRWRSIRMAAGDPQRQNDGDGEALSLGQLEKVRAAHGPAMARFISLQDELTRRSRRRFPAGSPRFWTSKGLEQATPAVVADHRARRFAAAALDGSVTWDACCGVGADAVALLRSAGAILATDWDPASARCAAANLRIELDRLQASSGSPRGGPTAALAARCDLRQPPLRPEVLGRALVLLDPDRRPDGEHREPRPERWAPPLSSTLELARSARGACIKLPPSLDATAEGLDRETGIPTSLEWISLDGEMKELALWTGALAGAESSPGRRVATALMTDGEASRAGGYTTTASPCALPEAWPIEGLREGAWLVELDPSLWQAELAGPFCAEFGLAPIVTELRGMFLVASAPPASPLARAWPILECVRADRKRVRALLREHGIGPSTVKKRNHPKTSTELEAEYRGPGERQGLLAVFRVPGASAAVLLGPAVAPDLTPGGDPAPG